MDEGIRPGLKEAAPTAKELRDFGLVLAGLLALFAFLAWRKGSAMVPCELGAAGLAALAAFVYPAALAPFMRVLHLWGRLNTFLIMFLFYFLIITPYALVMRLFGADLLDRSFRSADSYWKKKEPARDMKTYERQF